MGQWSSSQVYAYDLSDETPVTGEYWRLTNPGSSGDNNLKPTGIWSNGTQIYATDADHGRVFQYDFGSKSLTSNNYSLASDNGKRQGLWSDAVEPPGTDRQRSVGPKHRRAALLPLRRPPRCKRT